MLRLFYPKQTARFKQSSVKQHKAAEENKSVSLKSAVWYRKYNTAYSKIVVVLSYEAPLYTRDLG